MPEIPQNAAGMRIDPPRSVPRPMGARSAASAAPVPPLEPPAVVLRFHGLRVVPKILLVVLTSWANSGVLVLPRSTAPAARSRATDTASSPGTRCSWIVDPNVVRSCAVWMTSLTTNGTPSSGRGRSPAPRRRSHSAASSRARGLTVQTALTAGLSRAIRSRNARVTSVALRRLPATSAASSVADFRTTSSLTCASLAPRRRPRAAVQREVAPREPPGAADAHDPVVVHAGVGEHRQLARLAVEAMEVAAAACGIGVDLLEMQAAVPVASVAAAASGGVLDLEGDEARAALHGDTERLDLQHAVVGEARGVALGVAGVAREIVAGVEILDVDVVLRGERAVRHGASSAG